MPSLIPEKWGKEWQVGSTSDNISKYPDTVEVWDFPPYVTIPTGFLLISSLSWWLRFASQSRFLPWPPDSDVQLTRALEVKQATQIEQTQERILVPLAPSLMSCPQSSYLHKWLHRSPNFSTQKPRTHPWVLLPLPWPSSNLLTEPVGSTSEIHTKSFPFSPSNIFIHYSLALNTFPWEINQSWTSKGNGKDSDLAHSWERKQGVAKSCLKCS